MGSWGLAGSSKQPRVMIWVQGSQTPKPTLLPLCFFRWWLGQEGQRPSMLAICVQSSGPRIGNDQSSGSPSPLTTVQAPGTSPEPLPCSVLPREPALAVEWGPRGRCEEQPASCTRGPAERASRSSWRWTTAPSGPKTRPGYSEHPPLVISRRLEGLRPGPDQSTHLLPEASPEPSGNFAPVP